GRVFCLSYRRLSVGVGAVPTVVVKGENAADGRRRPLASRLEDRMRARPDQSGTRGYRCYASFVIRRSISAEVMPEAWRYPSTPPHFCCRWSSTPRIRSGGHRSSSRNASRLSGGASLIHTSYCFASCWSVSA